MPIFLQSIGLELVGARRGSGTAISIGLPASLFPPIALGAVTAGPFAPEF